MNCPRCDRPTTEDDQRFCNGCGVALQEPGESAIGDDAGGDAPGPEATIESTPSEPEPAPDVGWSEPEWAATGSLPTTAVDDDLAPTELQPTEPHQPESAPTATRTMTIGESPSVTSTATMEPITSQPVVEPFKFSTVTFLGAAAAILALVAMFTNVLSIETSTAVPVTDDAPEGYRVGTWLLADLAGNLPIAGLLAACCMMAGAVASGLGWRWGAGIAGGSGLAFAGIASIAIALVQMPIDAAHQFVRIPTDVNYTMSITRDLGYWLLLAAGAVGVMLFFASLNECFADRQRDLNPWVAAVGALAAVITVGGPLLPVNNAILSDNWFVIDGPGEAPAVLVATRLVQLGLLGLCGVVGFLIVRRYGIGLALGGSLPSLWLGLSVLLELTENPIGPGWRNPGETEMQLHGVTIIGLAALASMLILASVAAYDQTIRRR